MFGAIQRAGAREVGMVFIIWVLGLKIKIATNDYRFSVVVLTIIISRVKYMKCVSEKKYLKIFYAFMCFCLICRTKCLIIKNK